MNQLEWRNAAGRQLRYGVLVGCAALIGIALTVRVIVDGRGTVFTSARLWLLVILVAVNGVRAFMGYRNGRRLPVDGEYALPGRWTGVVSRILVGFGVMVTVLSGIANGLSIIRPLETRVTPEPSWPAVLTSPLPIPVPSATAAVGQPVRVGELEFTVPAPPTCDSKPIGAGASRATSKLGHFCTVRVHLVNRGSASADWSKYRLWAFGPGDPGPGFRVSVDADLASGGQGTASGVPSGGHWDGSAVFDIPAGQVIASVIFEAGSGDPAAITF